MPGAIFDGSPGLKICVLPSVNFSKVSPVFIVEWNGVFIDPGAIASTLIPLDANFLAEHLVNWTTPTFEMQYDKNSPCAANPIMLQYKNSFIQYICFGLILECLMNLDILMTFPLVFSR